MSRFLACCAVLLALEPAAGAVERSLQDYKYFRALTIDLKGRMPTRAEVAAFESDSFDLEKWIDEQLAGQGYADRLKQVYMDLLRLEVGNSFQFVQQPTLLRRVTIKAPDNTDLYVYFRVNQRRARPDT